MAFVQSKSAGPAGSATTIPVTLTSAVTVGNTLVVGVGWGTTAAVSPTVTDNLGNVYTLQDSDTVVVDNQRMATYVAPVTVGGACTVTYNIGASCDFRTIVVGEYSSVGAVDKHAITNNATGSVATDGVTSPSVTTTSDGQTAVGIFLDSSGTTTYAAGTGFNAVRENVNGHTLEDRTQTSAGAIAATETWGLAHHYLAAVVTLKAASSLAPFLLYNHSGTDRLWNIESWMVTNHPTYKLPTRTSLSRISNIEQALTDSPLNSTTFYPGNRAGTDRLWAIEQYLLAVSGSTG